MSLALQAAHRAPSRIGRQTSLPESLSIGGQDWPLVISRHPRSRRISVRVRPPGSDSRLPQILLTVPKRASLANGMKFLQANTVWLARELSRHQPAEKAGDGTSVALLGETIIFRHTGQLRGLPKREGDIVWLSGTPERFGARMEAYMVEVFEAYAQEAASHYAVQLSVSLGQIYGKTMRARWGSCSPQGDIALNWRLALAPEYVARYVIAHEVAHRREMNHSPQFWAHVRALMPDYTHARDWLKREGHTLYQLQL